MGGVYQGISWVPDDHSSPRTDRANLLFPTKVSGDEPYQLLNPTQAVCTESTAGVPRAHPLNCIDLTTRELVEYVDSLGGRRPSNQCRDGGPPVRQPSGSSQP